MTAFDTAFPPLLSKLHELDFDYDEGNGIDFEPYQEFQTAEDNESWFKSWTGNDTVTGAEYRVFGQDGTGGYAAIWVKDPKKALLEQPIVFFGSEGELGVVAADFSDYLWLLAGGVGPLEAVEYPDDDEGDANEEFAAFAKKNAKGPKKSPKEVTARARKEHPTFEADIRALSK